VADSIGSRAFHRAAELLMGRMDRAATNGDFRMAAAYAQLAADAEGRALALIPPARLRTRRIIRESQLALVVRTMEFEARVDAAERQDSVKSDG
jgi:hypothetical protein